ncbi:hypothetical protein RRG08_043045 [Elysia crispata]|uniref:Uncharacterized protein n=1 Tax=Elysia crispata TaxID=231223 RepID=A0AAE0XYH3_9GAST|nr:hypothetical protein RRG08_043045 [Elysia crispata]
MRKYMQVADQMVTQITTSAPMRNESINILATPGTNTCTSICTDIIRPFSRRMKNTLRMHSKILPPTSQDSNYDKSTKAK